MNKNKVKKHLSIELKKEIIKLADENLDKTGSRFISLKIGRNIARSSLREILDKKQEILSSSNNKSSNTVRVKPSVQQEFEEDMYKQLKAIFKTAILFDGKASCNTNCEERKILQDANTKNAILEIMELQIAVCNIKKRLNHVCPKSGFSFKGAPR